MNAKVGSWVRFYWAGRLVIGEVCYVSKDVLGYREYQTDVGSIREDAVLEVRNAALEQEANL